MLTGVTLPCCFTQCTEAKPSSPMRQLLLPTAPATLDHSSSPASQNGTGEKRKAKELLSFFQSNRANAEAGGSSFLFSSIMHKFVKFEDRVNGSHEDMEHITASEVAGFEVGALLLCATIAAPEVDAFISTSQRSSLGLYKRCGDLRMIACSRCRGTGLIKANGPFSFKPY